MSSTAVPRISYKTPYASAHSGRLAWGAALLIGAGCFLEGWSALEPTRASIQTTRFPLGDQNVGKLHSLLLERGQFELDQRRALPSTHSVAPPLVADGLPTIAIVSAAEGLYSPKSGIYPHATEKGRQWERPATISYFEGGELRYETHAGLRIHGGQSRKGEIKSFQLVFRRSYAGKPRATPGIFFGGESQAVQRLVLSNTHKPKRFLNPLAYDIASRVGCITSRHQPVRVFLNGERVPSGYFMIEHQSREFLRHHYGHDDFEWVRLKGRSRPSFSLDLLSSWVNARRSLVTMESAAERFDIDHLCAWIFAVSFCDTRDEDQGGYFKDSSVPDAVWQCLTWDMDGSFHHGRVVKKQKFDFERMRGLRSRLFRRMCENDPAFREYYRQFAERMLREQVSSEQIRELTAKYRELIETDIFAPNRPGLLKSLAGAEHFLLERQPRYLAGLDQYYASLETSQVES